MATQVATTRTATVAGSIVAAGVGAALFYKLTTSRANADSGQPRKVFSGGPVFQRLKLESSESVNHNTKRLHFQLPKQDDVTGLSITSAVLTFAWPKGSYLPVLRPYTPISASDEQGHLDLLVKQYPNGKMSSHLHSLSPGDSLVFVTAIPGFKWTANKHPHVTLIAGGAGITPIYQLLQGILRNPQDQTKIDLVFGVNSDADVLFKDEFEALEKKFPGRLNLTYTVSHPAPGSPYRKGYVTEELLREVTDSSSKADSKVFVCGPPPMEAALVGSRGKPGILRQLGYRKDQVHKF